MGNFNYSVTFTPKHHFSPRLYEKMITWCKEHCSESCQDGSYQPTYTVDLSLQETFRWNFKFRSDAIKFKLTWYDIVPQK